MKTEVGEDVVTFISEGDHYVLKTMNHAHIENTADERCELGQEHELSESVTYNDDLEGQEENDLGVIADDTGGYNEVVESEDNVVVTESIDNDLVVEDSNDHGEGSLYCIESQQCRPLAMHIASVEHVTHEVGH